MHQLTRLLVVTVALGFAVAGLSVPAGAVADRDCSDFSTQQQAQQFFVDAGGPRSDPHRLDADGDGQACDSLPCPCSSTTQPRPRAAAQAKPRKQRGVLRQRGNVVEVVDGDTVKVRMRPGRKVRTVRLLGIDTPEVYGGTECYGPESSAALEAVLPVGSRVRLVSDRSQARVDAYGRLLRYVIKGGQDVNRQQVLNGSAAVYVYDGVPFARTGSYRAAEDEARAAARGRWGACGG